MPVRSGDALRITAEGFVPSRYAALEWSKGAGDHIFFIYFSKSMWTLEITSFKKEVKLIFSEQYSSLDELLEKFDELKQEEMQDDDI